MAKAELRITIEVIEDGVVYHKLRDRIRAECINSAVGWILARQVNFLNSLDEISGDFVFPERIVASMLDSLDGCDFESVSKAIKQWNELVSKNMDIKFHYPELGDCLTATIDTSKFSVKE